MELSVELFQPEIEAALGVFDRHVVCLDKAPQDCTETLTSLMHKAIKAYESRRPGLRHGIALDKDITVILSQSDTERPLCGIYFNLHSPYSRQLVAKPLEKD